METFLPLRERSRAIVLDACGEGWRLANRIRVEVGTEDDARYPAVVVDDPASVYVELEDGLTMGDIGLLRVVKHEGVHELHALPWNPVADGERVFRLEHGAVIRDVSEDPLLMVHFQEQHAYLPIRLGAPRVLLSRTEVRLVSLTLGDERRAIEADLRESARKPMWSLDHKIQIDGREEWIGAVGRSDVSELLAGQVSVPVIVGQDYRVRIVGTTRSWTSLVR